ncbi:MAG: phosphoribosylanthranilate isomerase [Bacteroidetes bacterium]|nr:phosphoribosylanthranilate isomerase [Bacteroidota bacterium]
MNNIVSVKICCISSIEEAKLAVAYGAKAIGLVGPMPSGPGIITDELIHAIAKTVPPPIETFLLTSETSAAAIIEHHKKVNTTTIQMVDALTDRQYQEIRAALPYVKLVQVIHVIDENSIQEAIEIAEMVDAILLDSGNPNLSTKVLGGTGKTHNWDLSKTIRQEVKVPVFLAGGIHKDNVKQAIDYVQPFGVDLCSSVRTNKQLDEKKLEDFFKALI